MAKLNEPPVSTDSLDALRRKFLRQNRDIARVNSTQSLRIRCLENECARLLSENLDLRGQILRLEKEAENNAATRIADHALEIKAKLEAQLIEWGSLLAGLGLEPPAKKRSPSMRRVSKPRLSLGRSPLQKRPRSLARDAETQAAEEGRLPPIYENKTCPRQTLNGEEILALCSEAADLADSPDLGPPPSSRFVDDNPTKADSPCRPVDAAEIIARLEDISVSSSPERFAPPKLDLGKKPVVEPEKKKEPAPSCQPPKQIEPHAKPPTLRTGSKRKFVTSDENEAPGSSCAANERLTAGKVATDTPVALRDLKNRKGFNDPSASRKTLRDGAMPLPAPAGERKPLASKSTNEDLSSPKKAAAKALLRDEMAANKTELAKRGRARQEPKEPKRATELPMLNPRQAAIVDVLPEPEPAAPPIDQNPAAPDTPDRPALRAESHDTPPPADISSRGETARGGRRVRSAISYAEPSLRVKMRRPTKELVDAVAGEARYAQRQQKTDEHAASGPPSAKTTAEPDDTVRDNGTEVNAASGIELSPLAQKERATEALVSKSAAAERRRRPSWVEDEADDIRPKAAASLSRHEQAAGRAGPQQPERDPYEFSAASPAAELSTHPYPLEEDRGEKPVSGGAGLRTRPSAGPLQDGGRAKAPRAAGSRKRASMVAPKKCAMLDEEETDDDSYEPPGHHGKEEASAGGLSARDRISRRRSMML